MAASGFVKESDIKVSSNGGEVFWGEKVYPQKMGLGELFWGEGDAVSRAQ